jgi:hypothetical protein
MYDAKLAQESVVKIKRANYSLEVLTLGEKHNLTNMIDDWWESQGWDREELCKPYQRHQDKN